MKRNHVMTMIFVEKRVGRVRRKRWTVKWTHLRPPLLKMMRTSKG